jgi:hypothetical protein
MFSFLYSRSLHPGFSELFRWHAPRQDINTGSLPMFRQGYERLIGLFFVVRHLRTVGTPKKICIQKIIAEGARQTTFPEKNYATGEETIATVEDYMNRKL